MNNLIIATASFSAGLVLAFLFFTCGAKAYDDNRWQGSQQQLQQQQRDWQHRNEQLRDNLRQDELRRNPC